VLKDAVSYERWKESPPFQPFVIRYSGSYQEYQMGWNPYCIKKDALFYEFETDSGENEIELVPDACLNVLFELDGPEPQALFSGTFLHPMALSLRANTTYFGFKPYSNLGIKSPKINIRDMADNQIDFGEAFPGENQLLSDLAKAKSFRGRRSCFLEYAWDNLIDHSYTPTFVDYLTVILCTSHGHIVFNNIEQIIGYSERYCREKFKECYGISPKQYNDIIRFQNTLKALVFGWYDDLSTLAIECGYYDQSHLTRDFKRYTDESPGKYLERLMR